ncbi:4a-hydroxytetrahydrobiopterin dehydratase [Paenibacillus allorhizosphaerae]|uniref:Pterin-4-alpha-carbinolamine dehydratase n=1 Tax=Paenibacillus allorhizosphaerae TaxID=2849866 RepID=A0ABM8VPK9_9BACL|nr:4a-hydroxytetrahydrobiopterin dehydratase [Paenibacillus allorhizosphaerae]CAG7653082.1 Putative pterin-4-alpha-carbinolamine dehydratase [Paenibacillus allorhizosphaerae]
MGNDCGKIPLLTEAEADVRLAGKPGWTLEEEKWIVKKYRFPSFAGSIDFVNKVAVIAEELNHHPMIAIDYRMVTLRLTSWSAGGLTGLDFTCADRFDDAFAAKGAGG